MGSVPKCVAETDPTHTFACSPTQKYNNKECSESPTKHGPHRAAPRFNEVSISVWWLHSTASIFLKFASIVGSPQIMHLLVMHAISIGITSVMRKRTCFFFGFGTPANFSNASKHQLKHLRASTGPRKDHAICKVGQIKSSMQTFCRK